MGSLGASSTYVADKQLQSIMLPSLGFIGGTWADCLDIPINGTISGVRVTNLNNRADFVNFRYLVPVVNKKPLPFDPSTVTAEESSPRQDRTLPPYRLQPSGTGVHTGKEVGAWWQAQFDRPTTIDGLRYLNRRDKWGIRSQKIKIETLNPSGQWNIVYDSTAPAFLTESLRRLRKISPEDTFPVWIPTDGEEAVRWHEDAVHSVRAGLDANPDFMSSADWLTVASLIPTRTQPRTEASPLYGDQWRILAHGLFNQVRRDARARSGIASFGGVLCTRTSLRRLNAEIGAVSTTTHSVKHGVSRHGIAPVGVLSSHRAEYLAAIESMLDDLRALGSRGMLAYGTLLGAFRDGDFIQHDDDVDLFYTIEPDEDESCKSAAVRILDGLRAHGWKVTHIPNYMNVHVTKVGPPISLDLFPLDLSGSTVAAHMESMKVRNLPSSWFTDGAGSMIDGVRLPIPSGAREFLEDRYGKSWNVPDPFHDWSWQLKN